MRAVDQPTVTPEVPTPSAALLQNRALVIAVAVFAVVLGLLAAFAPSWLLAVDQPLSDWVRGWGIHGFFHVVTQLGSIGVVLTFGIVATALLWNRCRALAYTVPIAIAVGMFTDVAIKLVVDRPRPLDPLVGTGLGSFPSGHVIMTVIVLGLLPPVVWIVTNNRLAFRASVVLFLVGVPLVAVSRVNLGAHWPSDVVASVVIGAALLLGAEHVAGTAMAHREPEGCALHEPGGI